MYGFADSPEGLDYPEKSERALELINALRLISRPENRRLLERHTDDTFRVHELDASNPRGVVAKLSSEFLICDSGCETGNVVDWTTSPRGERLLSVMDEMSVYITDAEADALHTAGSRAFLLPGPDVWWTTADIDVDIHPRELRTLADAGIVEIAIDMQDGYSTVWRTSDRLHDIATVVWRIIDD